MAGACSSEGALLPIGPNDPPPERVVLLWSRRHFLVSNLAPLAAGTATAILCLPVTALAANGEDTPLAIEPLPAKAAESAGTGNAGVMRTIVGLLVVIGVIYGVTWILKSVKKAREEQSSGTALESLATLPLGPNRSLHLVRAGDVVVLLGVGEAGVTPIRTYHEEEARALGLFTADRAPGFTALAGEILPTLAGPAANGRVGRVVEGLRRRTVIR